MDSSIEPTVSAIMPHLSAEDMAIVRAIDEGRSYDILFWLLVDKVERLRDTEEVAPSQKIIEAFNEDPNRGAPLRRLFMSIPRRLLRSLALGTLAYDLWDEDSPNHHHHYPLSGGPGTYAVGVWCHGRQGRFLSGGEVEALRLVLTRYGQAVTIWHERKNAYGGTSQLTWAQRNDYAEAMAVDGQDWDGVDDTLPRPLYAAGDEDAPPYRARLHVNRLRDALASRRPFGASNVWQIASPLQVGCSVNMAGRVVAHDPRSSMHSSSVMLRLLTSAMRRLPGVEPRTVVIPVIKTWEDAQLPLSEILVTAIAGSMITEGGLNVAAPGANTGEADAGARHDNLIMVFEKRLFQRENIDLAIRARGGEQALRRAWAELNAHPELSVAGLEDIRARAQQAEEDARMERLAAWRELAAADERLFETRALLDGPVADVFQADRDLFPPELEGDE